MRFIRTPAVLLAALLLIAVAGGFSPQSSQPELPPGHPPMLPAGHPPVAPGEGAAPAVPAAVPVGKPADVLTPESIIAAYYDAMSGPVGIERDWTRFQSLFLPGARLVSTTSGQGGGTPIIMTPDLFSRMNDKYFRSSGYRERSVSARVESFGHIVQAWSTYESRRGEADTPYSRGINSFQLLESQGRWWIVSIVWDRERPGVALPEVP